MKQWNFSKLTVALLVFATVLLGGCSLTGEKKMTVDDCWPNYILDNGQKLLGNNNYPAISYSGDRENPRTVENSPSMEDIKEDLRILSAMGVKLLRNYNTVEFPQSERVLKSIRELKQEDPDFEMYVMLGAWIQCKNAFEEGTDHSVEDFEWNKTEIEGGIRLASEYPDVVKIIAVGNEAMVDWQAHFVPAAVILKWVNVLKEARVDGRIPAETLITTSDNWAALGGQDKYHNDDLVELLRQIDFVSCHIYAYHDTVYDDAFWVSPEDADLPKAEQATNAMIRAFEHQLPQYESVKDYLKQNGIIKEVHIGETGWATLDNSQYGDDGTCASSEYNSKVFYDAIQKWVTQNNLTCFYFEAFDEPWKSNGTEGSEGHFGLLTVDGQAKYALWDRVDAGAFKGLNRGGNPITKTQGGDESVILKKLKAPTKKK
jgi:exo-beta-1,3-glucanase (GH17 family)